MLSIAERLVLLKETAVFHDLTPEELADIAVALREVSYEPETMIIHQGDPGDFLGIVTSGTVNVFKEDGRGGSFFLRTISPGEVVGDVALLGHVPRTATIRAASAVTMVLLDKDPFEDLMGKHAHMRRTLSRVLTMRMEGWAAAAAAQLRSAAGIRPPTPRL